MKELTLACHAILRNKTSAILVAMQLAITVTVIVNEYAGITEQLDRINSETGLDSEEDLFTIRSTGFGEDFNVSASITEDLLLIHDTNGVIGAYATNSVPLSFNTWRTSIATTTDADAISSSPSWYMVDEHAQSTLGFKLLYGEYFNAEDIIPEGTDPSKIIISQEVAGSLFPGTPLNEVVGKAVYSGSHVPQTIIGIVDKLHAPSGPVATAYHTMLQPQIPQRPSMMYVVRTEPLIRSEVMQAIVDKLSASNEDRILRDPVTFDERHAEYFRGTRVTVWVLSVTMVVLLIITACGIVGLVSFTVQRQTKQIGTRRALGATVTDVAAYYLLQYGVICITGLLVGVALAVACNILFVEQFEFPVVSASHVTWGVLATFCITMLAVSVPSIRAAQADPAVALRDE